MASEFDAPPSSTSSLSTLNRSSSSPALMDSTNALMDLTNGSQVVVNNSLSVPLTSSSLVQDCYTASLLMEPASSIVPEPSATSEINVTLASATQDGSTSLNSPRSAQLQNQETKTSDINNSQTLPSENAPCERAFVPTLGAWAKPLLFKPLATPPEPSTPLDYDPVIVGNQLAALWPSLTDEILNKKPKSKHQTRTLQPPVEKLPLPELKTDGCGVHDLLGL
ncbi:hypothetical protein DY000_02045996 [Brassica cretica]|uniref:Uncharacterized protein n=1 Tax=Brassica cretica TaxID=69181 RepID=A0ABQ7F801_BRACR|nr:hypothetical protein DY000_02045996 [Brassica cretica]